jgi:hypothetical protein
MSGPVTINARKFDGSIHRSWTADLVDSVDGLLTLRGTFGSEIDHSELGLIRRGTVSYEYYWRARWFNVFRFEEPDGTLRNWYCNVNLPPEFDGSTLDYVDLDLDVLVWRDFRTEVLDLGDFERNARTFGYPEDIVGGARSALGEILVMIGRRDFPFRD